jgi:hypothetical protein
MVELHWMAAPRIAWHDLARFGPFCRFLAPPLGARREDKTRGLFRSLRPLLALVEIQFDAWPQRLPVLPRMAFLAGLT